MNNFFLKDVRDARNNINVFLTETPLVPFFSLTDEKTTVYGKLEITQPIGVFKIRGSINALSRLTRKQRQQGVICVSTGNHGRSLAYGVQLLGGKAVVCMSSLVPNNKLKAIEDLGAKIYIHGKSQDEAQFIVDKLIQKHGLIEIPPFDHKDIIAGQGTIALEILDKIPDIDTIIVPLSGGGLVSGIACIAKQINPNIKIIAVSPKAGAAMAASLDTGKPVNVEELKTIADSLGGGIGLNNKYTFKMVKNYVDKIILLEEEQIKQGMRHLFFRENMVVEGASAVGVSVLINQKIRQSLSNIIGRKVVLIISGKNIDMQDFLKTIVYKARC